jgi:hypothetical protein
MVKRIFILGCERSGSTWLSNIIDAHPQVEFFMEPFADYAGLFPGFPGRNTYLSAENEGLANLVRAGYRQLYLIKYPLLYKPNRPLYLKRLDRFLINKYQKFEKLLKIHGSLRIDQYKLLHLYNSKIPISNHPPKNYSQPIEVTKELRLNFKVGLLAHAFPGSKYIVIIRHPGAQISSVKNLFQRGHLGELNRSLVSFIDCIKEHSRFKNYWPVIDELSWENDLENKLILWWLINYEILLEDIRVNQLDYLVIHHEELSQEPRQVTKQLFEFCGLTFDEAVRDYLDSSSHSSLNKQDENFSPVDTTRNSADYYKQAIKRVDIPLNNKISKVLSYLSVSKTLEPCINRYREDFYVRN